MADNNTYNDSSNENEMSTPHTSYKRHRIADYLANHTAAGIEKELNSYVIGQPDLTKNVADFYYYHLLRQLHPELSPRPILISGPSGSGKTEIWRAMQKIGSGFVPIKIIDGSRITGEHWAGDAKTNTYITKQMSKGGILVIDEFDKLCCPSYSMRGENISLDIQAEFLKMVEGEYQKASRREETDITTTKMGFAFTGAFTSLFCKKEQGSEKHLIGFCDQSVKKAGKEKSSNGVPVLSDKDYIDFGMIPELIGRIAIKCSTRELTPEDCLKIVTGEHSRVQTLLQVLKQYDICVEKIISKCEIQELISQAQQSGIGIRWVSAQIENRILEQLRLQPLIERDEPEEISR